MFFITAARPPQSDPPVPKMAAQHVQVPNRQFERAVCKSEMLLDHMHVPSDPSAWIAKVLVELNFTPLQLHRLTVPAITPEQKRNKARRTFRFFCFLVKYVEERRDHLRGSAPINEDTRKMLRCRDMSTLMRVVARTFLSFFGTDVTQDEVANIVLLAQWTVEYPASTISKYGEHIGNAQVVPAGFCTKLESESCALILHQPYRTLEALEAMCHVQWTMPNGMQMYSDPLYPFLYGPNGLYRH